ncbi:hypothetical protein [Paenibacillus donghaensis]|uniref:Uncharacterized protein n=1 Tax=Paenibacillus donghaensis TaxID=414771 RepID=A0A2Z2KJ08_9BACL|nr:hypothetical protein [Paenibacillus donghaensis]ASA19751.1 hypothetical protein B9T62_02355 [Paenibacillus donghaensis]
MRCGGILQTLQTLKELLEEEPALYLTIAVSPVYSGETPITGAYGSLSSLLKERRLNEETQIIVEPRALSARSFHVKVTHGEELSNLLLSGNEEAVLGWLDRQLEQLNQKDAAAEDFRSLPMCWTIWTSITGRISILAVEMVPFHTGVWFELKTSYQGALTSYEVACLIQSPPSGQKSSPSICYFARAA